MPIPRITLLNSDQQLQQRFTKIPQFKTSKGFKIEFIETERTITEVKFIQPNGTFMAQRKLED